MATPTHLFRIFAGYDKEGNLTLYKQKYEILRETPKGYKILKDYYSTEETFVSSSSKNRFAYPTEEEALVNFHHRKKRELSFCLAHKKRLEDRIDRVNKLFKISSKTSTKVLDIPKGKYIQLF